MQLSHELEPLIGHPVVLDMASPFVILGTLEQISDTFITLIEADVHDLRDSTTTRELYVLDARRHGIGTNRKSVSIRTEHVVSLSKLADVIK